MKPLLIAGVALLLAGAARAEPIVVRSGEHPTFTRFVVPLREPSEWKLDRQGESYTLRIRSSPDLDMTRVFDLIPRTRVSSVDRLSDGVALKLACDCHAVGSEMKPGLIVIDVADGPPPGVPEPSPGAMLPWTAMPQAPLFVPAAPLSSGLSAPSQPDFAEARALIEARIARAADQGLVEFDPPQQQTSGASNLSAHMGLGALTSIDRDLEQDGPALGQQLRDCPVRGTIDIAQWGDDRSFAEVIGELRSNLTGEFDAPNVPALNRLVRYYLANGFGREAATEILNHPDLIGDSRWLRPLVDLVEGGIPEAPGPLRGMAVCDGPVALWALLADPELSKGREVNRGAVLQAYGLLPVPVRENVGPLLAERFLARGDEEAVHILRSVMMRREGAADISVALVDGRLAASARAEEPVGLNAAADSSGPRSAEALLLLIEGRLARGEPVEHDRAVQAEALAHELRGTALGKALGRAHVLALGSAGDFDQAFAVLSRQQDDGVRRDLLSLVMRMADDVTFLRYALATASEVPGFLTEDGRRAMNDRLETLGFAGPSGGPAGRDWIAADPAAQAGQSPSRSVATPVPVRPAHQRDNPPVSGSSPRSDQPNSSAPLVANGTVKPVSATAVLADRQDVAAPPLSASAAMVEESRSYRATLLHALDVNRGGSSGTE